MRLIGHVKGEAAAELFSSYLSSIDIKSTVEYDADENWAVWIISEDQIDAGRSALDEYLANPSDPKYTQGARRGEQIQTQERKAEAKLSQRVYTRDNIIRSGSIGPITLALIVLSVGASVYAGFAWNPSSKLHALYMSEQPFRMLPEIRQGEWWRLITPIFVHMGPIHLLFNMMWLKVLGTTIEVKEGSWKFIVLLLVFALASNYAQFYWQGPRFGGMSGVLYGLFGYIWMRWKTDPFSGYYIPQETVYTMIAWFFLCVAGFIGNVANAAHAGGLVAGMALGVLPKLLR